ncbi:hypothetical protein [Moraxella sp. VT-16-12]|uniref:hypothetical protein n=1 Tax=Moraxella sp. VT-16-12 TaxID=2014877 RepID=UPI000B7C5FC6|nr:hypothetical protein [Moraxella sp. VT-16-12]TWV84908.1 hypothetical protein CEW93_001655 [Moraxella sp. VT-16-12]
MNKFKATLLGLVMFSLMANAHTAPLSANCQNHATNIIQVSMYAFMCLGTDDLGWGDEEDKAFDRLESQVATTCADADDQAMQDLGAQLFAGLEDLNSETQLTAYCQSITPTVKSVLHQYK